MPVLIVGRIPERSTRDFIEAEVAKHIGKEPTDEKLEREVVDSLAALSVAGALAGEPVMDDAIADDVGRRDEPVVIGGRSDILPDR